MDIILKVINIQIIVLTSLKISKIELNKNYIEGFTYYIDN